MYLACRMSTAKKAGGKKKAAKEVVDEEAMREEMNKAKEWLASLSPDMILTKDMFDSEKLKQMKAIFSANKPFPFLSIPNFVDSAFLKQVLDELTNLDYVDKNNDLYLFSQSENDLKAVKTPLISKLREVLYSDVVCKALSQISGIELFGLDNISKPDFFAAVYNDTSRLLCHDDELEGRRIAFILYLVPEDWCDADGGHLDLFEHEADSFLPTHKARALLPKWASFTFFEVSELSYHQVREVLSANKHRVSIGGWFHGAPLKRKTPIVEPLPASLPPVSIDTTLAITSTSASTSSSSSTAADAIATATTEASTAEGKSGTYTKEEDIVDQWVHRQYRRPHIIKQVAKSFGEQSQVELSQFLKLDVYAELVKELLELETAAFPKSTSSPTAATADSESKTPSGSEDGLVSVQAVPVESSPFKLVGPPNLRTFYSCDGFSSTSKNLLPKTSLVRRFHAFLRSPEWFKFLTELTGCDFTTSNTDLRLFRQGCYTLSHDLDLENKTEGLDAVFTAMDTRPTKKWLTTNGGSRHYLRANEDEELLTAFPTGNTLQLVYRAAPQGDDGGILQFTRYVDHHAPCGVFHYHSVMRLAPDEEEEAAAQAAKKKKKTAKK